MAKKVALIFNRDDNDNVDLRTDSSYAASDFDEEKEKPCPMRTWYVPGLGVKLAQMAVSTEPKNNHTRSKP